MIRLLVVTSGLVFLSVLSFAQESVNLEALKVKAQKGGSRDQLEYGKALVDSNRDEAKKWIKKAADGGSAEAYYRLGYYGLGTKPSIYYYEKAAERLYPDVFGTLIHHYLLSGREYFNLQKVKKFSDLARKHKISVGYDSEKILNTIDYCYKAGVPKIPKEDRPTEEQKEEYSAKKSCVAYMNDSKSSDNWEKYRHCVISYDDLNFLAEIYANGWGVKRNIKLATSLICHNSSVLAELQYMVDHLYRREGTFLFCDHVTSGMTGGFCSSRDYEFKEFAWAKRYKKIEMNLKKEQKRSLETLKSQATAFFDEQAVEEQELSGSGRVSFVFSMKASSHDWLLDTLEAYERQDFPKTKPIKALREKLANSVESISKRKDSKFYGTISKAGILSSQEKWGGFKDSFLSYLKQRFPKVSSKKFEAMLLEKRIKELEHYANFKE